MQVAFRRTRVAAALMGAVVAAAVPLAHGSGFALQENGTSGVGNAYAGGAAAAEDASTIWSNPAGMSRLKEREAAAAIHFIIPKAKFSNDGSIAALNQPLGGNGGDAGGLAVVPNLFVVVPYSQQFAFGLGVNVPFGLTTEYDDGWVGRYHGLKSEVKTINVQPSFSWKVTDRFSLGFGIDFQWLDATLTSNANYSAGIAQGAQQAAAAGLIPAALIPAIIGATPGLDSKVTVSGDDTAWGFNIGALYEFSPGTRVGIHYRSEMKFKVRGNVDFDNPALPTVPPQLAPVIATIANNVNNVLYDGGVHATIKLPQTVNLSFFHQVNDRWDVMADLQWTGWSSIQDLTFVRNEGPVLQSTPENFDDTWRVAIGANYRFNDRWMLRGGLAYDESPVNARDRTPRLPDSDRVWVSVGAQYKYSDRLVFDAGYTYIFLDDSTINTDAGSIPQYGLLRGNYRSNVNILSLQASLRF